MNILNCKNVCIKGVPVNKMIEFRNVSKSYGKVNALNDVSLSIEKGSAFGYIGPNGAGKTTSLKILLV